MGNILTYIRTNKPADDYTYPNAPRLTQIYPNNYLPPTPPTTPPTTPRHRFRLPCGQIKSYSKLTDYKNFGKVFKSIGSEWGTGPYKEWQSMIVDEYAIDYPYVKAYTKKINRDLFRDEYYNMDVCKNCEAYGDWEMYDSRIMICKMRCTNCVQAEYNYKVMRIQRCWRLHKSIDTLFQFNIERGCYLPI